MDDKESTISISESKTSVRAASVVAAIAAVATIIASFIGAFVKNETDNTVAKYVEERVYEEIAQMRNELQTELEKLNDVKAQVQALSALPSDSKPPETVGALVAKVGSIEARLATLEAGLVENPAKALSTPLLRKDMEALQKSSRESLTATQKEIERIYDQNKWFIGLIATMAVGVLGLAVSNLFKTGK